MYTHTYNIYIYINLPNLISETIFLEDSLTPVPFQTFGVRNEAKPRDVVGIFRHNLMVVFVKTAVKINDLPWQIGNKMPKTSKTIQFFPRGEAEKRHQKLTVMQWSFKHFSETCYFGEIKMYQTSTLACDSNSKQETATAMPPNACKDTTVPQPCGKHGDA